MIIFMKKILILISFLFILVGCKYSPNNKINRRTPPVIVIAVDTSFTSVILRDGDNKVFTIFNTATTHAISKSLKVGDTVRIDENGNIKNVNVIGDF